MSDRLNGTPHRTLALLALLSALGCQTPGTAQLQGQAAALQPPSDRFDLVIYGQDFDPAEHEVFLRTNLDFGSEWVSLGNLDAAVSDGVTRDGWATAIFPDLSTERFFGQDFREQYLEVRILTRDGVDGSAISALYVMPHSARAREAAPRIQQLIESDPVTVEQHSIASHVQPSPRALEPGVEYVEHVRAPMKHTLPGVMEVEQLQVEWRNRDG